MTETNSDLFFVLGLMVMAIFGCFMGYSIGVDKIEYKQKIGSVIIQQWDDNIYLLINPFTGGFYSDHETLEEAVLSALELYKYGQINKIIFDLNRDGIPDETLWGKTLGG